MSDEWRFVVAAYAITWAVLIGYTTYLSRRWSRAQRRASGEGTGDPE